MDKVLIYLTFGLEKSAHKFATLLLKDSGGDRGAWMEWRFRGEGAVAALVVGGAVDYTANLRPSDGSRTHQARLHCDI